LQSPLKIKSSCHAELGSASEIYPDKFRDPEINSGCHIFKKFTCLMNSGKTSTYILVSLLFFAAVGLVTGLYTGLLRIGFLWDLYSA
jgi:hypothetical protein